MHSSMCDAKKYSKVRRETDVTNQGFTLISDYFIFFTFGEKLLEK